MLPDLFDLPRPPRPPAALPWTEERLRHLRRRWKQGARAREIGAELGVSANAVIAQIPIAQRRSLLALSEANCRWPVGKPGSPSFFFCGAQVLRNKPYCAAHCARAYLRPRPPRPRDDRVQRSGGGRGGGCPHPQTLPTSLRSGGGGEGERAAR